MSDTTVSKAWVLVWTVLALLSVVASAFASYHGDHALAALSMTWACYAELRRQANVRGIP